MPKEPFLKSIARASLEQFDHQLDRLTLIFPNRRAGLFYRKYLSEYITQPAWSPTITTLEDFITSHSKLIEVNPIKAMFTLYTVYCQVVKHPESFDKFYYWGNLILKDFSDVDNYLVDPDHIFRVIGSQRELDEAFFYLSEEDQKVIRSFWAGFLPKASKNQNSFLSTWKILSPIYKLFAEQLKKEGFGYKGMIYREVVQRLDEIEPALDQNYWFAGFNALNTVEKRVIERYINQDGNKIIWDLDDYYVSDINQEAGHFIREHQKSREFQASFSSVATSNLNDAKKIVTATSVSLEQGQVKSLANKLANLADHPDFVPEKTAIVLPDEHMLIPLLNSIPDGIDKINVTMGYPLKETQHYALFEILIKSGKELHKNGVENNKWYYQSVLDITSSPILNRFYKEEFKKLRSHIFNQNRSYIAYSELTDVIEAPCLDLFIPRQVLEQLEFLEALCHWMIQQKTANDIERSALIQLHEIFVLVRNELLQHNFNVTHDSFLRIWRQLGSQIKIPFSGEPLEGVQIMGVLETRNLDFKHVFILSMNEGKWPSEIHDNSFIPYNIRKAFDLPVAEHQDALQAYLFYRLLQSADTIDVYYNNISEFNQNGELSRFIRQIELETDIQVVHQTLVNKGGVGARKDIVIQKDDNIRQKLKQFLIQDGAQSKRLSPSALNTYLDCRLKFYFQQLERISEIKEVEDDLNAAQFGNLLHYTMEDLYGSLSDPKASLITHNVIQQLMGNIDRSIDSALITYGLKDKNKESSDLDGRTVIAHQVIKRYAEAILKHDLNYVPFEVTGLEVGQEEGYTTDITVLFEGENQKVGLKGIIDRIDQKEGRIRILDYKSGRDERKAPSVASLFDREENKRNKAIMQVLYYCLLYRSKHQDEKAILVPGIFNSRDLFLADFDTHVSFKGIKLEDFALVEDEYLEGLENLIQELYDVEVPFDQTEDLKKCDYCPYANICMRN